MYKGNLLFATGSKVNALYISDVSKLHETSLLVSLNNWHKRVGHAFHGRILQMHANSNCSNLKIGNENKRDLCSACSTSHPTRTNIPKTSNAKLVKMLGNVYSDVCGPIKVSLKGGQNILSFLSTNIYASLPST